MKLILGPTLTRLKIWWIFVRNDTQYNHKKTTLSVMTLTIKIKYATLSILALNVEYSYSVSLILSVTIKPSCWLSWCRERINAEPCHAECWSGTHKIVKVYCYSCYQDWDENRQSLEDVAFKPFLRRDFCSNDKQWLTCFA